MNFADFQYMKQAADFYENIADKYYIKIIKQILTNAHENPDLSQVVLLLLVLYLSVAILAHMSRMAFMTVRTISRLWIYIVLAYWLINCFYNGVFKATSDLLIIADAIARRTIDFMSKVQEALTS
ncbi:hypothetical protein CANCADRAFT_56710 [Tortispora caseinolytica NRRL Y-17796]|uniref:Uncharacterized protein n=1 Tax=Tortispora caseinolytica NRRL Y-17796 TaxID=767744 RepID=A0A1E4TEJ1_9ASCO|nr:hypothetical protein CANCADRAFT_56710 [Tortispora caseinolytica NRRL Y-17796]